MPASEAVAGERARLLLQPRKQEGTGSSHSTRRAPDRPERTGPAGGDARAFASTAGASGTPAVSWAADNATGAADTPAMPR